MEEVNRTQCVSSGKTNGFLKDIQLRCSVLNVSWLFSRHVGVVRTRLYAACLLSFMYW